MIIVRPFEKRDLESVNKIFDKYWQDDFRNNLSTKLDKYFQNDPLLKEQKFKFFIAEEDSEVQGIDAIRKLPDHMMGFALTNNPAEWYIAAVKDRGKGIGTTLVTHILELAKGEGYTEVLLFSGEIHQES